jgi:tRNA 2-thiouridine synthesizing protein C
MIIVISHAPFNNTLSYEAIELALGLSSVGLEISLIFMDDGVYHLCADQETKDLASKNFLKNLNCLDLYDIVEVYVCKSSLDQRQIIINNIKCTIINNPLELLQNSQHNLIL